MPPSADGKAVPLRERVAATLRCAAGGAARAAVLLDISLHDAAARGCGGTAALWCAYVSSELAAGRAESARRALLRGLHSCPGAKTLWLGGLAALASGLGPRESSGLLTAAGERELLLRADVYEVLLARLGQEDVGLSGV
jgi:hypothetical protein